MRTRCIPVRTRSGFRKVLKRDINISVTSFDHRCEWAWSQSFLSKISSYLCFCSIYQVTSSSLGHIYRIRTPKESTQRSQWIDNSPLNSSPSDNSARVKPLSQKPSTVYGRKKSIFIYCQLVFPHWRPESGTYGMILSLCFNFESGIIVFNVHRIKHLCFCPETLCLLHSGSLWDRQWGGQQQSHRPALWPGCNHFYSLQGFLKPFKAAQSFSQPQWSDADNNDMTVSWLFLLSLCEEMLTGTI